MMNPMELQDDLLLELYNCGAGGSQRVYNYEEIEALWALKSDGFADYDGATDQYYITAAGEDYIQTM